MKTKMKFDLTRKQHLILVREVVYNHMQFHNYPGFQNNEDFIKTLMKDNNCSSKEELCNKIDAEIKKS